MSRLPHDPYITAICDVLTTDGLTPADTWTSDAETAGSYRYLSATITLTPEDSGIDADRWPNGLILRWEWHTGIEAADGEPERGPVWLWAKTRAGRDGTTEPQTLTADGYTSPATVAAAARAIADGSQPPWPDRWEHAHTLDAACTAWATTEAGQ